MDFPSVEKEKEETRQHAGHPRKLLTDLSARIRVVWVLVWLLAMAALVPTLALAQEPSPEFDPTQVPIPTERPMARLGQSIYLQNCAACHGETGLGDGPTASQLPGPPTAFADPQAVWERSPGELFFTTKFGRIEKLMPPWRNQLDDRQVWQVVYYAWSLHTDPGAIEAGRFLYDQTCAACHGPTGAGDGPQATSPMPDFSDPAQTTFKSQADWLAGWQAAHPDVGADWSDDERRQVLEYIRTFTYAPPWESPFRPGNGTIRGTVVMGTPGVDLPADLTATLDAFLGFEAVATFTTTVAADGSFVFQELDPNPDLAYLVTVPFAGVNYAGDILTLTPDAPQAETQVTLYETTQDPSQVFIARTHWILDEQPGELVVAVLYTFGNQGDRTFVGRTVDGVDVPVTVAIHVPAEAQNIVFQNGRLGDRFRRAGDRIYDTAPIVPGQATRQIVVQYTLPHEGGRYTLAQRFFYPVRSINLLVPDIPGLQVEVPNLQQQADQTIQDQTFHLWTGQDLPADSTVEVRLAGLLAPDAVDPRAVAQESGGATPATTTLDPRTPWLYAGLVLVVLLGGVAWAWSQGLLDTRLSPEELQARREALLDRIARLDDLHALGELDDATWQRRRAELKRRLLLLGEKLEEQQPPAHTA